MLQIIQRGIVSLSDVEKGLLMTDRQLYLPKHSYAIYQGKDGFWYSYLPDQTKSTKRRQVKRKTQTEVEDAVIFYYKQEEENPAGCTAICRYRLGKPRGNLTVQFHSLIFFA